MQLKQSYILTIARYHFSLYEQRILIKIVEEGQVHIKDKIISQSLYQWVVEPKRERIKIRIKDILSDNSQHYDDVKQAARALAEKVIEYEDTTANKWAFSSIIYDVITDYGYISFYVSNVFWRILYDFTLGYSWYDLETILSLRSSYTIKMYMFICAQRKPMRASIAMLKKWLGCEDSYKQTRDFIKRVIEPARVELDKAKANGFTYSPWYTKNKVTALDFKPINRQSMQHTAADKAKSWAALTNEEIKRLLICDAGFTIKELENNKQLLSALEEHPMALDIVQMVMHHAKKKEKGKGYIINGIKSELGVK